MSQSQFAQALLDPMAAVPAGLVDPQGRPAPRRFAVYRNTVAGSLTRALEAGFPTVRALVGAEFFAAMALVHLRTSPPRSRMLMLYGADFPDFLAEFPPVAHLGYLPDVARLELGLRESYHAADSQPLPESEFQRLLGDDISLLRLQLAPAVRLLRSSWPVVSIWEAHHGKGPLPHRAAEDAIILRPEFDPRPSRLPRGGADFLAGVMAGRSLGESLDLAGPGLDLAAVLGLLVAGRAILGVVP